MGPQIMTRWREDQREGLAVVKLSAQWTRMSVMAHFVSFGFGCLTIRYLGDHIVYAIRSELYFSLCQPPCSPPAPRKSHVSAVSLHDGLIFR